MSRATLFVLSSLCPLCLCGESLAALDPEAKKPYDLNIVVHVERTKLLTDVFKERVERELNDWMQEEFGELARVRVTDKHPWLGDVLEKGLQSLDGRRERSPAKTHFVLIRFADGVYEIQARQYDGLTGLVSPLRNDRTRSPDGVSRAAALLLKHDFGLVGTVVTRPDAGGSVKVEIKGGELKAPLGRWVAKGEVFALVRVRGDNRERVPWAVLRVTEAPKEGSGVCTCRLFYRFDPNPLAGGDSYRCLKLGTKRGPLHLRILEVGKDNTTKPLENDLTAEVSSTGFDDKDALKVNVTRGNGVIDTTEKDQFDHVAFVKINVDPNPAKVPVPIVDDQLVDVRVQPINDPTLRLRLLRESWGHEVSEAEQVQVLVFQELKDLASKQEGLSEAVKKAHEGLARIRQDYAALDAAGRKLEEDLKKENLLDKPGFNLSRDQERLRRLKSSEQELITFVAKLEEIDKKINDPRRKNWAKQLETARALEKNNDLDEAIALYQKMLDDKYDPEDGSRAKVEARLAELKKEWAPKSPEHEKARQFVTKVWPKLDIDGLEKRLEKAKAAVKVCRDAKDVVTLGKFVNQLALHGEKLEHRLKKELSDVNPDDAPEIKRIGKLSSELFELGKQVNEFLEEQAKEK